MTNLMRAFRATHTDASESVTGHYVCPRCGKRGDTEKGLIAHLLVVHGEKP